MSQTVLYITAEGAVVAAITAPSGARALVVGDPSEQLLPGDGVEVVRSAAGHPLVVDHRGRQVELGELTEVKIVSAPVG